MSENFKHVLGVDFKMHFTHENLAEDFEQTVAIVQGLLKIELEKARADYLKCHGLRSV